MIKYLLMGLGAGILLGWGIYNLIDFLKWRKEMKATESNRHGCWDCKHSDMSFDDEPCCYCDGLDQWEDAEK